MEPVTTELPSITPEQFRALFKANYQKRKARDLDKFLAQKKADNARAYLKAKAKRLAKLEETPTEIEKST